MAEDKDAEITALKDANGKKESEIKTLREIIFMQKASIVSLIAVIIVYFWSQKWEITVLVGSCVLIIYTRMFGQNK